MLFDYVAAAERVGISAEDLARLTVMMLAEFPSDEMMAELHILRAILSVERGDATLDGILRQKAAAWSFSDRWRTPRSSPGIRTSTWQWKAWYPGYTGTPGAWRR